MEDSNMKKALLIIALLFASARIHASHARSELHIRMFDNSWFTVNIDHQRFDEPVTRFHLDRVSPGTHYITIKKVGQRGPHGSYGGIRHIVVFSGYVNIPAASDVRAMIDRANRFRINRIEPLFADEPDTDFPDCNMPVACNPAPVIYQMDDYEFSGLMNTLRNMQFESSRMSVAKNAILSNQFSSRQVADLMGLMTFDSSRLEIAKLAYAKTIDRENYWMVYDLFAFESSIVELNNYIHRA
jgi:Domain of unknown function (DUF4476)